MDENITAIMNGFFKLPNLEKLKLVEAINEYFDSDEREKIRAEWETKFAEFDAGTGKCACCGRTA